jgi:predicted RNase H-like HicB family nuclease
MLIRPLATTTMSWLCRGQAGTFGRMPAGKFVVEIEREDDGRWIAEVLALPGVMAYGSTRGDALVRAAVLALRVVRDRLEHGEPISTVRAAAGARHGTSAHQAPIDPAT